MPKIKFNLPKKNKPLYLEAFIFLLFYFIVSHIVFVRSLLQGNLFIMFLVPTIMGSIAGMIFLFLFNHEDFFKFAKIIEKRQEKREKKWLLKFRHSGKIVTSFALGIIGGPVLTALTVRILLKRYKYRYPLVAIINIPSALFSIAIAKGFFSIIL